MNRLGYSNFSDDDLIKRFISGARHVGGGWDMDGKPDRLSPEAVAIRQELRAIAAELLARRPVELLLPLFDNADRNVRGWAAGQLWPIDEQRAKCGLAGFGKRAASGLPGPGSDLTATETLAFRQRALQRPPRRPPLGELTVQQLVGRFEDACLRRFGAKFVRNARGFQDVPTRNRIVSEIAQIVGELHTRDAVVALLPLLDHPNLMARYVTAEYCLPLEKKKAVVILEEMVAARDPVESFFASNTLDDWRRGVFTKLDYPERAVG